MPSTMERIAMVSVIVAASTVTVTSVLSYLNQRAAAGAAVNRRVEIAAPREPQSLEGVAVLGRPDAQVAVIAYSDFQCPYCAGFARETLPALKSEYVETGRVKIAFKHLPLPMHQHARRAAEAAECSARQGRFWEMHDRLFENPSQLDDGAVAAHASALGLDRQKFDACLAGQMKGRIAGDIADARKLSISGTPTFLVGRTRADGRVAVERVLAGALPLSEFKATLDTLLR